MVKTTAKSPPVELKEEIGDYPSKELVWKATELICKELERENMLSDYHPVKGLRYVPGKFSGFQREECFAICNMRRETGSAAPEQCFVMLFYKTGLGQWKRGNFWEITQQVKFEDLNNDGLPELICYGEWVSRGYGEQTDIYSAKMDVKTRIYSNYVHNDDSWNEWKVGDVIETKYEISFIDTNRDGIMEIQEKKIVGILESMPDFSVLDTTSDGYRYIDLDDTFKTKNKTTKKILYLKNGKYN
jgi:hypothetical protein